MDFEWIYKIYLYAMKVLHVSPGIEQISGGPSVAVVEICKALYNKGIDVDLITTYDPLNRYDLINFNSIKERLKLFPRWERGLYAISRQMKQWLSSNIKKYDLVHIHGIFSYPCHMAATYAKNAGIAYIIRPHGSLDPWHFKRKHFLKLLYIKVLWQPIVQNAYALHATSKKEAEYLAQLFPKSRMCTIPLGVNLPDFENPLPRRADEPLRLLFLSRFHPKKGIPELIYGVKELVRRCIPLNLRLAGQPDPEDESYEYKLRQLVKEQGLSENVTFCGFLFGINKTNAFMKSHLFVLLSKDENFGIAVAEALSFGLPVVISNQVAIAEDVSAAEAGIVIKSGDSGDLADAIERLALNENLRLHMANQARRLSCKYSWQSTSAKLINLYHDILQEKS
ncbi:MAG: glycosyltransferase [Syntrophaceae bacterium]|nr:glycosyltransferase [Syntrophaceae bacterium]